MALIKCSECGKEISDKAKSCPGCGNVRQEKVKCLECGTLNDIGSATCENCGIELKEKINIDIKNDSKMIIMIIIGLLAVFIGYKMFFDNKDSDLINKKEIWSMVQEKVKDNIDQLSGVKFEKVSDAKFFFIGDNTYEVIGSLKGENNKGVSETRYFAVMVNMVNNKPAKVTNIEFLNAVTVKDKISTYEEISKRIESGEELLTAEELDKELKKQPLYVEKTVYQDGKKFSTSNDLLQAILYNNSSKEIKKADIAFVAWDKDKKPLLIKELYGYSDKYFYTLEYDDISLEANKRYTGIVGNRYYGLRLSDDLGIAYSKAVVVSYEDVNGGKWENPLIVDFKYLYENKTLVVSK